MYSVIAIIIFCVFIGLGFAHGFLRRALSLVSVIVAGIIAWVLSGVFHSIIPILPKHANPFVASPIETIAYKYLDQVLWFVVLFAFLSIVLMFLKAIFKKVNHIPIIGGLNRLLGGLLGFIEAFLILSVLCAFLKLPIINQREQILSSPVMSTVDHFSTTLFFSGDLMNELDTLNKMAKGEKLSVEEKQQLIDKAVKLGISKEDAQKYLEKY